MKSLGFKVTGMTCAACSAHVEKAVSKVKGVKTVNVNLLTNSMLVALESPANPDTIIKAVQDAGYDASIKEEKVTTASLKDEDSPKLLKRLIISIILMLPLLYLSMGYVMWHWPLLSFLVASPTLIVALELVLALAVMIINQRFFINGFKGLIHLAPNMDTLVALGSAAAFLYSAVYLVLMAQSATPETYLHGFYFESSAMILTLITVGKLLEAKSKGKTTSALKGLLDLTPKTAHLLKNQQETEILAAQLKVNDTFLVRPGESIPADGIVLNGSSAVNEAALTGESLPVDKSTGSVVKAATINQNGVLTCRATETGQNTAISQIIEMVSQATATKAPIAKVADHVAGVFVPVVIAIAIVTFVVWLLSGASLGFSLARAISVLVISCPCALGLATPVAIMVGSGLGARHGLLFKTAGALEATGKTTIAVFDKTGTITQGVMEVTDLIPSKGYSQTQFLQYVASLENLSEHPLAQAIQKVARSHKIQLKSVQAFQALPGQGVQGIIAKHKIKGANAKLAQDQALVAKLTKQGKTVIYFTLDGKPLGLVACADTLKLDAKAAIQALHTLGVQTVMLTGDNYNTAHAIAKAVGIEYVQAEVLPQDKAKLVQSLLPYGKVLMVGDGINDAPALTAANVGMAVAQGSDLAIEAAEVVLMKPELKAIPEAIRLSRRVLLNIRENLFWAFFYNCLGIPVAAGVFIASGGLQLSPMLGALMMSLSSCCVVLNALRLNLLKVDKLTTTSGRTLCVLPPELFKSAKEVENMKPMPKSSQLVMSIEGMMCEHCAAHVKEALLKVKGVQDAKVDLKGKSATISVVAPVTQAALFKAVKAAGYEPISLQNK